MNLPDVYQPKVLRYAVQNKPLEVRYGIGIKHAPNQFGMTHGPFYSIMQCLEIIGEKYAYILQLPTGQTLYRWKQNEQLWEKLPGSPDRVIDPPNYFVNRDIENKLTEYPYNDIPF